MRLRATFDAVDDEIPIECTKSDRRRATPDLIIPYAVSSKSVLTAGFFAT